jgi:hypothetical protein
MAGGPLGLLLQRGSPVPLNYSEHMSTHGWGSGFPTELGRPGFHASTHARCGHGAGTLPRVGIVDHSFCGLTLPRNTGRRW